MVGFSKLLIGAFIPSAFGNAVVEAQTKAPKTTITYAADCSDDSNHKEGMFLVYEGETNTKCKVTGIAKNADYDKIIIETNCTDSTEGSDAVETVKTYTTDSEIFHMQTPHGLIPLFTRSGDEFTVGDEDATPYSFDEAFCVLVDFPTNSASTQPNLRIAIGHVSSVEPVKLNKAPAPAKLYQNEDGKPNPVEESAFFGEDNGEWSFIDFAFIAVIVVLLLCFCLGLYGCWSKKKKMEKDSAANRPAKNNHRRQAIE